MRVFQAVSFYKPYLNNFNARYPDMLHVSYDTRLRMLIRDRFMDLHVLRPVLDCCPMASFSVVNDANLMNAWVKEYGMAGSVNAFDILLNQIEESRAEVFYTLHPKIFNKSFIRRLPGCVKAKVAWLAAPDDGVDFSCYDGMLSNFPPLIQSWRDSGLNAYEFFPGVDERVVNELSHLPDRPIQISFAGQYSPTLHHRRNALLASLAGKFRGRAISLRLQARRWKPLIDVRGFRRINTPIPALPSELRDVAGPAVYGRSLYELFGSSQIVFNGTIDFANAWRVNMRCFEIALAGACMLGDSGRYSSGFVENEMFATYKSEDDLPKVIEDLLSDPEQTRAMGQRAQRMVLQKYNKTAQWSRFEEIVSSII